MGLQTDPTEMQKLVQNRRYRPNITGSHDNDILKYIYEVLHVEYMYLRSYKQKGLSQNEVRVSSP